MFTKGGLIMVQGAICLLFQPTRHLLPPCLTAAWYGGMPALTKFKAVHQNGAWFCTYDITLKHSILRCCQTPYNELSSYLSVGICIEAGLWTGLDLWTGLWTGVWTEIWTDMQFDDDQSRHTITIQWQLVI